MLYALLAMVIVTLGHRAARANGRILQSLRVQPLLVVAAAAGACGAWSETMRQLALVSRDRPRDGGFR
jgi:ABC-type proline/glycine betaine transport system permease subunit